MNCAQKFIAGILVLTAGIIASCKKNNDPSNTPTSVAGSWKVTRVYRDTSINGTIEPDEQLNLDTSTNNEVLTFYSNNTEITRYYGVPRSQTSWELEDNNMYMKVVDTGINGGTGYLQVITLNTTTMVLKDTTGASVFGAVWTYFTRQ